MRIFLSTLCERAGSSTIIPKMSLHRIIRRSMPQLVAYRLCSVTATSSALPVDGATSTTKIDEKSTDPAKPAILSPPAVSTPTFDKRKTTRAAILTAALGEAPASKIFKDKAPSPAFVQTAVAKKLDACTSVSALKALLHSDVIEEPKDMVSWTLKLAALAVKSVDAMHEAQTLLRADRTTGSMLLATSQTLDYGPDELKMLSALHVMGAPKDLKCISSLRQSILIQMSQCKLMPIVRFVAYRKNVKSKLIDADDEHFTAALETTIINRIEELTDVNDLHFVYLSVKLPPQQRYALQQKLAKSAENLTQIQCIKLLEAHAATKMHSAEFIDTICKRMTETIRSEPLTAKQSILVFKTLSQMHSYDDSIVPHCSQNIGAHFKSAPANNSFWYDLSSVVFSIYSMRLRDEHLLGAICDALAQRLTSITSSWDPSDSRHPIETSAILTVLRAMAGVNYSHERAVAAIKTYMSKLYEVGMLPAAKWLEVVHQMTILDELDEAMLKTVAVSTFVDAVHESYDATVDDKVKQVILMKLSAIGAEARYGLGINEQHTPLTHLIQKTSNKLVGNLQNAMALTTKYGPDAESIASAFETMLLGKLFQVETHALTRQLTNYAGYVDAMVVLNADGTCKPTVDWEKSDRRTAILFWTRAQTSLSGTLLGHHVMTMRHLLMTGHGIVQIFDAEIEGLDADGRRELLETKLANCAKVLVDQ